MFSLVAIMALLALFLLAIVFGVMYKWKGLKNALITTAGVFFVFALMMVMAIVVIVNSMGN